MILQDPEDMLDEIPRRQRRPLAQPLAYYRTVFADDPRTGMALAYLRRVQPIRFMPSN